jgi:hypothetical protein
MDTTSLPRKGRAVDVGAVHRHVRALLHIAQAQACLHQRLLEAEGAAEHKGDEVGTPVVAQVRHFLGQYAVAEHAIARNIGADVEILAERGQPRIARRGHGEQRTGLRVALAEEPELIGVLLRQDADVSLHVAGRHARGVAAKLAGADGAAQLAWVVHRRMIALR